MLESSHTIDNITCIQLQKSLRALLKKKSYANITVQQVLEKAQVSRATFYTYFSNKSALLYSLEQQLPVQLEAALQEETAIPLFNLLFRHAEKAYTQQQKELIEVMLPEIGNWVRRYLDNYDQRAWRSHPHLELWKEVAVEGAKTLLVNWLKKGVPKKRDLAEKANQLLFCCLKNAQ